MTILLILSLLCIIFSGINYHDNTLYPSFYNMQLKPLSIVQIAFLIYCAVIAILGFFIFCCSNACCFVIYAIFLSLGVISLGIIGGFSIVANKHGWVNAYIGCNTQWQSLKNIYNAVDVYVQHVDQILCSQNCKCQFTPQTIKDYTSNSTLSGYFGLWSTTNDPVNSALEFKQCPNSTIDEAYSLTTAEDPNFISYNINLHSLYSYMAELENKYHCAGFCHTKYFNTYTNTNMEIVKYLFTNINNGPPEYSGCMNRFIHDVPSYLIYMGSASLAISVFLFVIFILSMCMCTFKTVT